MCRRSADDGADVSELALEHVAQVAQLGPGELRIGFHDAFDVVDLEDRVGKSLRRSVVDLPGEASPLRFLRLHDSVHSRSSIRTGLHRQTISNTRVGDMPMSSSRKHSLHGAPASMSSGQCSWSSPSERTT